MESSPSATPSSLTRTAPTATSSASSPTPAITSAPTPPPTSTAAPLLTSPIRASNHSPTMADLPSLWLCLQTVPPSISPHRPTLHPSINAASLVPPATASTSARSNTRPPPVVPHTSAYNHNLTA